MSPEVRSSRGVNKLRHLTSICEADIRILFDVCPQIECHWAKAGLPEGGVSPGATLTWQHFVNLFPVPTDAAGRQRHVRQVGCFCMWRTHSCLCSLTETLERHLAPAKSSDMGTQTQVAPAGAPGSVPGQLVAVTGVGDACAQLLSLGKSKSSTSLLSARSTDSSAASSVSASTAADMTRIQRLAQEIQDSSVAGNTDLVRERLADLLQTCSAARVTGSRTKGKASNEGAVTAQRSIGGFTYRPEYLLCAVLLADRLTLANV